MSKKNNFDLPGSLFYVLDLTFFNYMASYKFRRYILCGPKSWTIFGSLELLYMPTYKMSKLILSRISDILNVTIFKQSVYRLKSMFDYCT